MQNKIDKLIEIQNELKNTKYLEEMLLDPFTSYLDKDRLILILTTVYITSTRLDRLIEICKKNNLSYVIWAKKDNIIFNIH